MTIKSDERIRQLYEDPLNYKELCAPEFTAFPKIPRLNRECIITEKIDGTNASIFISDDLSIVQAGSRTRWITPEDDNYGFAKWVQANREELIKLGPGHHFGEWWGQKIQRGYGLTEKRFSLFNTIRWTPENTPKCCYTVPEMYRGMFNSKVASDVLVTLETDGSKAAPRFMNPEGIIIYHIAGNLMFKATIKDDEKPKGSKE